MITITARRLFKAAGSTGLVLLPLAFPQWASLIAEAYETAPPVEPSPLPPPVTETGSLTDNGRFIGETVVGTCKTGNNGQGSPANQAFQADCDLLVGNATEQPEQVANALNQLTADQINAQNATAQRQARMTLGLVTSRLQRLRMAGAPAYRRGAVLAENDLLRRDTGGGASADMAFGGGLGGFLNLRYLAGDEDKTRFQPGFDFDAWSVFGGLDYRFSDQLVGGLALKYNDGNVDYDNNRGDMDSSGWELSLYGSYDLPSGLYFDGSVAYGTTDMDLRRRIAYSVGGLTANQEAKSSPDANAWTLSAGIGYSINRNALSISPLARITYINNDVSGFTEHMSGPTATGGSMALRVDSQTYESLTSNLGVQLALAMSQSWGVLVPQGRLEWVHEYKNDQKDVGGRFLNDINALPFIIRTREPDRDYVDLGLGASVQFAEGKSGFLFYETLLGYSGLNYNAITGGVRIEF